MNNKFPPLNVEFDDGEQIRVEPKARDMAFAERDYHHDYQSPGPLQSIYATALATLHRMRRADIIDRELPDTPDGLMEIADIEVIGSDDPEGKGSDPAPTTG